MLEKILEAPWWSYSFFGNTVAEYAISFLVFVALSFSFKIFFLVIISRLERLARRTETSVDDAIIEIVRSMKPPFYTFIAFYFAIQTLTIPGWVRSLATAILIIWVVYQVIAAVQILIDRVVKKQVVKEDDKSAEAAMDLVGTLSKIVLWVLGILLVLSNLGVDITSLIAGLGIGGIAVALALQNVLGDLFSSFAIYFDKPFKVGDFIIVGDKMGVVQKIGIKTTRIRALQGEEIVMSNNELTSAHIQNFKKLQERRIQFSFGVTYDTSNKKLKEIVREVREVIEERNNIRFDRVHFKEFGDSALIYEVVYYINSPDYNEYMDTQEAINLGIRERFENLGVEMAYPTQTLYLKKE